MIFTWNYKLIAFIIFSIIEINKGFSNSARRRDWDICSYWNGRRHFLELGERGELHAYNVSTSNYRSTLYSPANNKTKNPDLWYQCSLELVTCAECVIRITFTHTNFSKKCEQPINTNGVSMASRCPCEHVMFSEPPYDILTSGQDFCGDGKVFRSQTRALLLKFYFRASFTHVFSLQYFSERNVKIISGSPRQSIVRNYSQAVPQVISTPYFPMPYPRDYGVEHILTCESEDCYVRLEFTDFQLGLTSSMEIFDSNGQMLDTYNGEHFRPSILVSSGKSLLLQFRGNGVTALGYKAEVTFVSANQIKQIPSTDCGGMVESLGGAITMMDMVDNQTDSEIYDCIWIIKPGNNYMMMKTHISLRIDTYTNFDKAGLTIRQGITSDGIGMELIQSSKTPLSHTNHIVPALTGFYIRFKGSFKKSSRLAIVYSVFNYLNCYIGSEFLCENSHCISIRLHCDGFDHCGDGSDEPEAVCKETWSRIKNDRNWYSHKPNYYFPKIEQYPDLKTATGIFIMSTMGILVMLTGWMLILYRMGVRARHQRELQSHLQTISELLDRQDDANQPEDHPPDYEPPPDYEQVIKIGMDNEISSASNRRRSRTPQRSRSRGRRYRNDGEHNRRGSSGDILENLTTPQDRSNNLNMPGPSTESNFPDNIQDAIVRAINSTALCEAAIPTTSTATQQQSNQSSHPNGHVSCDSSISNGCALPNTNKPNSAYSLGTSTQPEECSFGFRDDIDISLSLAIPQTTISDPKSSKSLLYNENNHLKKAWVVFNTGQIHTISQKRQRLRQTYSSPENFLYNWDQGRDFNFIQSNNKSDRNSYLSNGTMFGSDLPSDSPPCSPASNYTETSTISLKVGKGEDNAHQNYRNMTLKCGGTNEAINNQFYNENNSNIINYDSDGGPEVSCFGSVHIFNHNKKQINYHKRRRNGRSRSLTQNELKRYTKTISASASRINLRRCSSMEMLLSSNSSGYYV